MNLDSQSESNERRFTTIRVSDGTIAADKIYQGCNQNFFSGTTNVSGEEDLVQPSTGFCLIRTVDPLVQALGNAGEVHFIDPLKFEITKTIAARPSNATHFDARGWVLKVGGHDKLLIGTTTEIQMIDVNSNLVTHLDNFGYFKVFYNGQSPEIVNLQSSTSDKLQAKLKIYDLANNRTKVASVTGTYFESLQYIDNQPYAILSAFPDSKPQIIVNKPTMLNP